MYTVYVDGRLLYAPNLIKDGFALLTAKVDLEENKAGSFRFTIPPSNPEYDNIKHLTSVITVYNGSELIFYGRVLNYTDDFYKSRSVYCEGFLSVLVDTIVRPYKYNGTVRNYLSKLITEHNSKVEPSKRLTLGNVTVTDPNNYIVRESSDYPRTWDEIEDKLLNLLGGYIVIRHVDGVHYIDYLADYGSTSNQVIQFAENLLDIDQYISGEDVYTVIVPLGARNESTNEPLTIKSVNNNRDYIESTTGVNLFGKIERVVEWEDVTLASNLKTKATAQLEQNIALSVSLEMRAFDLHILNVNTDSFKIGDRVRTISTPHGLDKYFKCSKMSIDLLKPDSSVFTFGLLYKTLTGQTHGNFSSLQSGLNTEIEGIINRTYTITTAKAETGNYIGDVNGDGNVNMTDVELLNRFLSGEEIDIDLAAADINDDGSVSMADVVLLSRFVQQKEESQVIVRTKTINKGGETEVTYSFAYKA